MNDRLVALVDMDCFYCQVETRLNPSLKGKPMAVVQYNQWKGGGIIAVNYEARDRGVTRHMRGEEAKKHCPEIQLVSVPCVRGKADLTKYRDAGREVIKVICEFSECVQRASVDEAYIDLTEAVNKRIKLKVKVSPAQLDNTFIVGYSPEDSNDEEERERGVTSWLEEVYGGELQEPELHRLATAAALVEEMRETVFKKTGFHCSAGISHNKILAKLVCGLHKPRRQTVLPMSSVPDLYRTLPLKKVRNLGGKLGDDVVDRLGIKFMSELAAFTEKQLQAKYDEKTGSWLYNIARGIDLDPVTPQLISKSIGCRKNFPGKTALGTRQSVTHWISELAEEVAERIDEDLHMNKRKAQLMTVHFSQEVGGKDVAMSRSVALPGYEAEKIASCALSVLNKYNSAPSSSDQWNPPLKYLGISTGKFVDLSGNSNNSINKFFKAVPSSSNSLIDPTAKKINYRNDNLNNIVETSKDHNANEDLSKSINTFFKPYPLPNIEEDEKAKVQTIEGNLTIGKENCEITDEVPVTTNRDNNVSKPEVRTSFFERYFKNQPNKIVKKCSIKEKQKNGTTFTKIDESVKAANNYDCTNKHTKDTNIFSKSDNTNHFEERVHTANSDEADDITENNQESWISPSEIFPDLDNIDDSIMNILPSPLQRKISKMKCTKENSSSRYKTVESEFNVRLSSDSECAPTRVETVADVYPIPGQNNAANQLPTTSSKCVISKVPATEEEEDDLIQPEGVFDRTSLDLFESSSNEMPEEEHQRIVCDKCKNSIPKFEIQEHLDHHMALELQEQFNKQAQPNRTVSSEIRTSKSVVSDKKKRGRPSKKDIVPPKKSRTIMSFFTKT